MATTTATRTPQNKEDFNHYEEKQSLCTCVLNSGTFLWHPVQNNNVKWTNSRLSGEREHKTVIFFCHFLS